MIKCNLGLQPSGWIKQVSLFSSVHIKQVSLYRPLPNHSIQIGLGIELNMHVSACALGWRCKKDVISHTSSP